MSLSSYTEPYNLSRDYPLIQKIICDYCVEICELSREECVKLKRNEVCYKAHDPS